MSRKHDRSQTPPHLRRAPKGSTLARFPSGRHTVESFQHFAALQAQLGVNEAETLRQALARAVHVEPLLAVALAAGDTKLRAGVWHLTACPVPFQPCSPECSAVRLALQELGHLSQ